MVNLLTIQRIPRTPTYKKPELRDTFWQTSSTKFIQQPRMIKTLSSLHRNAILAHLLDGPLPATAFYFFVNERQIFPNFFFIVPNEMANRWFEIRFSYDAPSALRGWFVMLLLPGLWELCQAVWNPWDFGHTTARFLILFFLVLHSSIVLIVLVYCF